MINFHAILFLSSLFFIGCSRFLINTEIKGFNDPGKCPNGFKLAVLHDQADWHLAAQLAIETLGPSKSAWINSGGRVDGAGNEQWTLITPIPKNSCEYPPKDLRTFCLPIYWAKMSPNMNKCIKLPSICQIIE